MNMMTAILMLLTVLPVCAQSVALAWDASPSPGVVGYRIHCGTNANLAAFVMEAGLTLTQAVVLPHPGQWFFAVTALHESGSESDFSNVVEWEAKPVAPLVHGETWVRLTPRLERSTNLVDWVSVTGEPTWFHATNALEFFRVQALTIERVPKVSEP